MPISAVTAIVAIFITFFSVFVSKYFDIMTVPRKFKFFYMLYSNIEDLEIQTENLRAKKEDIVREIAEGERKSRRPVSQVEAWKKAVDAITPEIQNLVNNYRSKYGHHRGFSFICFSYLVGMECQDQLEKVKDLLKRGSFDPLTVEIYSTIPIPTPYELPGPLEPNHAKALEYVQNDNSANIIGIRGMAGVGKTTLLSKIHSSCIELSIFDQVIWVDAFREITLQKVQRQITQKLGLKEVDDTQSQASIIFNFLQKKKFLMFIDHLWEMIDLKQVGIPNPLDNKCDNKRKVVFATREEDVCSSMAARKIIEVKYLDSEKSMLLLKEIVGEQFFKDHPRRLHLAQDVAKECKGLPLSLIAAGSYMYMRQSIKDWEYYLYLLRKSQIHEIHGAEGKLMRQLKLSYDNLATRRLKNCFLSVSMWPEGYNICKNELIQCWIGLDLINDFDDMKGAYLCGFNLIGRLQGASLLESGENDATFNEGQYVKMHDVIRDMAIWIASHLGENKNKWIVKAGTGLHQMPNIILEGGRDKAERISLMHNHLTELPLGISDCSNLGVLMLQRNDLTCKPLLNCFTNFHSLEYLDLCGNRLNGFPKPICALTALRYLNLSLNLVKNIPERIKDLEKLKHLILRLNPISDVPKGVLSKLVNLLVLDLFCAESSSYVLCADDLRCLEKTLLYLGITIRTHEDLNEISLLSHLRVGALCIQGLHDRSFHFMSMIQNLYCLKELNIQHSHDSLEEIVFHKNGIDEKNSSLNLETLTLEHLCKLNMITWNDMRAENLFVKLQVIRVFECELLEDITWVIHLPSLLTLDITGCKSMRIVVNDAEDETNTYRVNPTVLTFPSLKRLTLDNMEKLKFFSIRPIAIPQLKKLQVFSCPLLEVNEIGGISFINN